MQSDLTPQQFEQVLQLCSILQLEDFLVATTLLRENNWNLEQAMGVEEPHPQVTTTTNNNGLEDEEMDYNYIEDGNEQGYYQQEYEYYQQQVERNEMLEAKKKQFNEGFISIPLLKTKSEVKTDSVEARLQAKWDAEYQQGLTKLGLEYQADLHRNASVLYSRILSKNSKQLGRYFYSLKTQQTNKNFITHLLNQFQSPINFSFGSLHLQLARSHLAHKPLLVYVHSSQHEDSKALHSLLSSKEVGGFLNRNFVCFGMFDSAEDFEIVGKYVGIKDLPAFLVFCFKKNSLCEKLVGVYQVLQKGGVGFVEWLAEMAGIPAPKKEHSKKEEQKKEDPKKAQISAGQLQRLTNLTLMQQQNQQYNEMARLHELKRNNSQARRQQTESLQQQITALRSQFTDELVHEPTKTIQIRFRMPATGTSMLRVFSLDSPVGVLFDYVHCMGRAEFEDEHADFDLTQTFPTLRLAGKKQLRIREVFGDEGDRENLIVMEL